MDNATNQRTVTKDGWGVSYCSGSDIDGVILDVYRFDRDDPQAPMEKCPECYGRPFLASPYEEQGMGKFEALDAARAEATEVALAHGHLQIWTEELRAALRARLGIGSVELIRRAE